jgi:hypothetical protein
MVPPWNLGFETKQPDLIFGEDADIGSRRYQMSRSMAFEEEILQGAGLSYLPLHRVFRVSEAGDVLEGKRLRV